MTHIDNAVLEFLFTNKLVKIDNLKRHDISCKVLYSILVACNLPNGPFFINDKSLFRKIAKW